jgi:flagellar FliJ protein
MGAFKFRLDPVVSLKKRAEDLRRTELAEARKELGKKENRLVNLFEHRKACQQKLAPEIAESGLDVPGRLVYYAYMERLTDAIADQTAAVKQTREDVDTKLERLLESSREKKALENLKQRVRDRFVRDARRAEQASLDDTAGNLHRRTSEGKLKWKKEQ